MKYIISILMLLLSSNFLFGKNNINVEEIFKMQIFLDQYYNITNSIAPNTEYDLYPLYSNNISLKITKLESYGINSNYCFYSVDVREITYTENYLFDHIGFAGLVSKYVLCIDNESGRSYKIMGFECNEFLDFLVAYRWRESFFDSNLTVKTMTDKDFLKEFEVEGVDFNCLYEGLRQKNRPIYRGTINGKYLFGNKYPCLLRITDGHLLLLE